MKKTLPNWDLELYHWERGVDRIAGVDEVGMGALAGPVVAGAVIFDGTVTIEGIRDSKLLSPKRREVLAEQIQAQAQAWAVGQASVEEIDSLNIRGAAVLAMRRAIDALSVTPELLLIDGLPVQPHPRIPATALVDGDAQCMSIAAASIIAKVHRDALMRALDDELPAYALASNKGYGSRVHLTALAEHGPSRHHRQTYAPVQRAQAQRRRPAAISA